MSNLKDASKLAWVEFSENLPDAPFSAKDKEQLEAFMNVSRIEHGSLEMTNVQELASELSNAQQTRIAAAVREYMSNPSRLDTRN